MIAIHSAGMARPRPLEEIAQEIGVSRATMWRLVAEFKLSKYRMPGKGKTTHLDLDEVREKVQPRRLP